MAHYFGNGDWLKIADNSALALPAGNWSLGGWIKVNSNDNTSFQWIFLWGNYAATPSCTLGLRGTEAAQADNGLFRVYDSDGDNEYEYTDGATFGTTRAWQHFLVVRNGAIFTVYLDNVPHGDGDASDIGAVDVAADWTFGNSANNDFDLAEWAMWETALSSGQRTALLDGVRPTEVGTRPAWYVPMLANLDEEIAGLTVTNSGTTVSEHPPATIFPAVSHVLWAVWPAIGGPYQVSAAALAGSGAVAGHAFSTGTMIGQVNEQ